MGLWLAASISACVAMACTCPTDSTPACGMYSSWPVAFLGTVLEHSTPQDRNAGEPEAYLVQVDERFRGLQADVVQAVLDPGPRTSCQASYRIGKQYLFFTARDPDLAILAPAAGDAAWVEWIQRGIPVLSGNKCGSRETQSAEEDLAWLRARVRAEPPTRVYGRTLQNYSQLIRPDEESDVPLVGARVMLQSETHRFESTSDANGRFEFQGVPPGGYTLSAGAPPWVPYSQRVSVVAGGCVLRYPSFRSEGRVEGVVRNQAGEPRSGISVELVRVLPNGTLAKAASARGWSDGEGRYVIEHAPSGHFQVGVNLTASPTVHQPYRPTAHSIVLEPHQTISGLDLSLPLTPQRPARTPSPGR